MTEQWTAEQDTSEAWQVVIGAPDEYNPVVCNVWPCSQSVLAPEQRARLISAALDMAEVLPALLAHSVSHYGNPTDRSYGVGLIHDKASAALAKIRGEV